MPIDADHPKYDDFLRDEYLKLHDIFEDFDKRALTIKGWVAGGAVTALAVAFGSDAEYQLLIPWFVIALAATFWVLEALWKLYQHAYRDRIRVLEAYFRGDADILDKHPTPFQINRAWEASYQDDAPIYPPLIAAPGGETGSGEMGAGKAGASKRPRALVVRFFGMAFFLNVALPYAMIILLSLVSLWVLHGAQATEAEKSAPAACCVVRE